MTVVRTMRDPEALTLTIIAELAAPPSRVWQVWADPRRLERWWGPPTWPATFVAHDFTVGGSAHYYMTGPGGEKAHGWWRFATVEEPRVIEFEDGFADGEVVRHERRRRTRPGDADHPRPRRARGDGGRHPHDGHVAVRQHGADGAAGRDGHGGGHPGGDGA